MYDAEMLEAGNLESNKLDNEELQFLPPCWPLLRPYERKEHISKLQTSKIETKITMFWYSLWPFVPPGNVYILMSCLYKNFPSSTTTKILRKLYVQDIILRILDESV